MIRSLLAFCSSISIVGSSFLKMLHQVDRGETIILQIFNRVIRFHFRSLIFFFRSSRLHFKTGFFILEDSPPKEGTTLETVGSNTIVYPSLSSRMKRRIDRPFPGSLTGNSSWGSSACIHSQVPEAMSVCMSVSS